jgi:hypothetical protein
MLFASHGAKPRLTLLAFVALCALVLTSAASAEFPTKRADPGIVGTPQEGQTLQGRTGQWLLDNGLKCEDCNMSYTWQRCEADGSGCVDVPGRTTFDYALGADDVGKRIRFVEWIQKVDCGAHNTQTGAIECRDVKQNGVSAMTQPVAPKPVTTAQASNTPTVAGVAMEDEILRATGATWTGPGTITKQFFWQKCNTAGEGCATILGAVGPTYRIAPTDVGTRIRVIETATNEGGASQAVSAVTAVVEALRPTATRQTLPIAKVALPYRLVLDEIVTRQRGSQVTIRVKVEDNRGFRIVGAQVWLTPTSLLAGSRAARTTTASGWATFTFRATGSGSTFVYADARKRGEAAQRGISTANLFRVRVR